MRVRWLLGALVALALVAGTRAVRVRTMDHLVGSRTYEDVYYVPPPAWLPVLSLGFDEALADLIWVRTLLYFGDELQHRGDVEHAFDYADAILALDPDFRRVYRWVGMAAMYRPVEVTEDDIRRGIAYLERGARRFPMDGKLAWDLGASLVYELGSRLPPGDEKDRLKREGLEHMQAAARLGAGPPWLVLANASQLERLGQREQAIRHLVEMYDAVQDDDTRAEIATRLEALRADAAARALRATLRSLEDARQRDFPYAPAGLYLLLGDRPPVDAAGALRRRFVPAAPRGEAAPTP